MTAKTRGSLASYQWLLQIYRHLVVIFIKHMSRNYKRVATFWQKKFCHHLWSDACKKRAYFNSCALLGHYAASSGNFLPTFRDNLSVPSSWVNSSHLKTGPVGCPETPTRNYHYSARNDPEDRNYLLRSGRLKSSLL